MMRSRTTSILLLILGTAGCDRPKETHADKPVLQDHADARPAPRSIMRPAVEAPKPAPPAPLPTVINIPFDKPGMVLDDAQIQLLKPLVAQLSGTNDGLILRGSTDSHGGDRRNRVVSLRRARLVAAYLAGRGIARSRMTLVGLGEDRPIAPNAKPDGSDDPIGRALNRRVEIEIVAADSSGDAKPAKS